MNGPEPTPQTPGAPPGGDTGHEEPGAGHQLATELGQRLAPFDQLAQAAGLGRPFTTQALGRLPTVRLVANLDADTARAIVAALHPAGVDPAWWQTPLGRTVAGALTDATPATEIVKIADAARMLAMSHSRVIQLADNGHLTRHNGGVTLASVYRRIAQPGRPGRPGWRPSRR